MPAYAGIPITYPDAGDVVTLVRGHEAESDAPPKVDWARLAGLDGTLVCYAGAKQIGAIARALLEHGRSPRRIGGAHLRRNDAGAGDDRGARSATIAERARDKEAAMLIVGAVVGLREHLRWFDERPLFGRRIVVTRSREQAAELVEMLEERGADAIQAPTIRIAPPDDPEALDRAVCDGRRLRLDRLHERQRRRLLHAAAARERRHPRSERRPPVRDRAVDGGARLALRHPRST